MLWCLEPYKITNMNRYNNNINKNEQTSLHTAHKNGIRESAKMQKYIFQMF